MNELRRQYLEALDIPVWLPRDRDPSDSVPPRGIRLGPGNGGSLFVCTGQQTSSTRLAADIARVLPDAPVWAWPGGDEGCMDVEAAVQERLFTAIVVFGDELAAQLFGASVPGHLGSARLIVAPSLSAMAESGGLRRDCWRLLADRLLAGEA